MRWRWLLGSVLFALTALAFSDAPAQQSETRVALIIANRYYASSNLGDLPGTHNDAALMEAALRRAGFAEITVRRDRNREQMRDDLSAFTRRLEALGPRGVGFLYYSGHGISDSRRGRNYLIPVNAQISALTDLPTQGLPLNEELDAIETASAKATIVVIDACRNTPVALGRGSRGLVAVSAPTRTLVAFSTQPGATATDEGVYARVLSQRLQAPGADVATVFQRVQTEVARTTSEAQVPRYDNGLIEPIVFVPIVDAAPTRNTAAPAGTHDLASLHPDVRRAAEQARAAESRANAAAQRARNAATQAETVAARARAGEPGTRTLTQDDGDRYEGGFRDRQRNGHGVLTAGDATFLGDRYAGQYSGGVYNGVGVYSHAENPANTGNLLRYEGEWARDMKVGQGVMSWRDGMRYAGDWQENARRGYGVHLWSDGSRYEGEWANDIRTGYGVLWDPEGRVARAGIWTDGQLTTQLSR